MDETDAGTQKEEKEYIHLKGSIDKGSLEESRGICGTGRFRYFKRTGRL
jgi:hypothetical protein